MFIILQSLLQERFYDTGVLINDSKLSSAAYYDAGLRGYAVLLPGERSAHTLQTRNENFVSCGTIHNNSLDKMSRNK